MSSPEIMTARPPEGASESTRTMFGLLDRLKTEVATLSEQQNDVSSGDEKAQRIVQTHNELNGLYEKIRSLQAKLAMEGDAVENERVQREAVKTMTDLGDTAPAHIRDLLGGLAYQAHQVAEFKKNDPGATMAAVSKTAEVAGGHVGSALLGGTVGPMVASAAAGGAALSAGTVALSTIGGVIGAGIVAPLAVETLTKNIKNPVTKAWTKTGLYTLIGGAAATAAALTNPFMLIPLGISFGITGITSAIQAWQRSKAEAAQKTAVARTETVQPARGRVRVGLQGT